MSQESTFSYHYSAQDSKEVESIRKKYLPREESKLAQLKKLDAKVRRPANRFAGIFGSISAIIMGCGMSLVMTDIADTVGIQNPMLWGIAIGVVGLSMSLLTYPLYRGILGARRQKYADRIIALSDQIVKG